jgi:uncharacterized OsmC-like protein
MDGNRRITMTADAKGNVLATNKHGVSLPIDPEGKDAFSPLELLLAALGSCAAVDVELLMRKQRDPIVGMRVTVDGDKEDARMQWLRVTYAFDAEHQQKKMERAITKTEEDLCSVSRTLRMGTPVEHRLAEDPV